MLNKIMNTQDPHPTPTPENILGDKKKKKGQELLTVHEYGT